LDLRAAVLRVDAQRHDGVTLRRGPALEERDLALVQEELPRAERLVVLATGMRPRRDVDPAQPGLALLDPRVAVPQVRMTRAERLDLRAGQAEPGLDPLLDGVVEARPPVVGELDVTRLHLGAGGCAPSAFAHAQSLEGKEKSGCLAAAALKC